jgi:hypothetical protein
MKSQDRIVFYTDDNVHGGAIRQARQMGLSLVTAYEAGNYGADDVVHFAYALDYQYVVVTGNILDFEKLFYEHAATGKDQPGLVLISPRIYKNAGLIAQELRLISEAADQNTMKNRLWRIEARP